MSDLPHLYNVQPSHTDLMTSHTVPWQPSETHWAAIGNTANRRFSTLHCKQFGQILRAFINLWGCLCSFWTWAFTYLIWWHAKLSITFESISGSAKKTFPKSKWCCSFQAEGRVWKRREQMHFNRNVRAYDIKTPSYSYTSTHLHTQLPVCFSHTPNSIWKPSSSCREADRKAILV